MSRLAGNPRCERCNGHGGTFRRGRWHRCVCTQSSQIQRDLQHYMYRPADHWCDTCQRARDYLMKG